MRRAIALIAAALLVLAIAGPVAADPIGKSNWPHVYVITCTDGTVVPDQFAHGVPGWDIDWAPGDTPWLLMGYKLTLNDGSGEYVSPLRAAGLVGNGKLVGPCTITADGAAWVITDAWFLKR